MRPGLDAMSELDVQCILQAFDANRDGEIDLDEFIEACGVLDISSGHEIENDHVPTDAPQSNASIEDRSEEEGRSQKTEEDPEMDALLKQAVAFLQTKAELFSQSQREEPDAAHLERQRQGTEGPGG